MIDLLTKALPKNTDGVIIFSEENRKYFTGFSSEDAVLIITKNGAVYLDDGRYIEAAEKEISVCEVRLLKNLSEQLPEILKEFSVKKIGVEQSRISLQRFKYLKKVLKDFSVCSSDASEKIINNLRAKKSEKELEKIIKAQRISERAFDYILKEIAVGKTEKELALQLDYFMLKNGADAPAFETILIGGEETSVPHGVPTDRKIRKGDFITMDFGAEVDGYRSDMTRTVAVGEVSDEQAKVYDIVLDAQLKALEKAKIGVKCSDVDKAARDVIDNAGYGEYFVHSTGHSVGIEIHELPSFSPRSKAVLQKGNIMTVEPGIYIPTKFGVRIEDMIYIDDTVLNLTKADKKLIIL
ncbi:MAG: aminopeptidase P family protein [Clostridia bacterium]|nr:aminopeptidase P family protein [Clostridia bacterium]